MVLEIGKIRSRIVAYLAVFIALITVFDVIPMLPGFYGGIWDSWIFLFGPLIGVLLGPFFGFLAVGFGSLLGHIIYFRDPFELVFMLGACVGTLCAALIFQRRWKPVLVIYAILLGGYLLYPVSWTLPIIGIWDILLAFGLLLLFSILMSRSWWPSNRWTSVWFLLLFAAIIGLEADILFRVFVLVPGQTYWLFYGLTPDALYWIWITAGIITPTKVVLGTLFSITVGFSLLRLLPRTEIPLIQDYGLLTPRPPSMEASENK
ncbi:MAG: hypothetical protein ACFFBR_01250 [Promethearchaeota archaeon]